MAVEIHLLGSVDALVDGRSLPLKGSKQRAVLAMLALPPNRTVSAEALIDGLWGDDPPASAAKNVQLYVSQLRKALAADDCRARIVTHGRGYELELPEEAVDAMRFEQLVERAQREADRSIPNGAAQGALELWRGAPLADVAEQPFAEPEIRRLEELHMRATELSIDAELAAGHHEEVIGALEALLAEHPLHERFHAQRMLALYRAGRQSEALEAYRAARRTLTNELGLEPGPELRGLERDILTQDPSLDPPALRVELPPQLEAGSPLLAGRERELRWLRKRWQEAEAGRPGMALVAGPHGIGKTRLAAELAAEVQRAGGAVLYAGSAAPDAALGAVRGAGESERPTLLVIDDADEASPALLEAATAVVARPPRDPLLVLVLHEDQQGPPAFARLERAGFAPRLTLGPVRADAVAEIAELYAPSDGVAMPLATLVAESQGVPLRVHRTASAWAQGEAAQLLEATVGRAATERGGLRAVEAEVAGRVSDLQSARERTRLYMVEGPADPSAPSVCPFRGLAPFDAAHAEYFFGRERLVAVLVSRIVGSSLLAVVGPSGSGKSSLVRAGLLPALANGVLPGSERWRQALMRPGEHPLAELRRALARTVSDASGQNGDDPFADPVDSLRSDERLVLTVDQLEEIFTACRDEGERAAFVETLVAAAGDPDQKVVVVLAIRADFYGRCAEYRVLSEQLSANQVLVGPMRRDELRRAIDLPARRAGLQIGPGLVSALVGEVADEPGGLPLLSTTLVELWEARSSRRLHQTTYAASGGISGAVARLAERAYRRLNEPQRARARSILMRLTDAEQPTPVRRRVPLAELETDRDAYAGRALAVLIESRLVTVDEGAVEVAHEALLSQWPRLRGWLEEDAEGRRLHQHLILAATEWQRSGRDPAELYRGARLAAALDWSAEHEPELNQLEREFLDESRATSEREAERQRRAVRRLRTLLAGVGVLLAAAVVAGAIAISERQGASSAARSEAAQRLGAEALNDDAFDRALGLASAGVALDDSVATRSNLLSTLIRYPATLGVLHGDGEPIRGLALSPDGRTLALGDVDGTVRLFDTESRELIGEQQAPGWVDSLAFDPTGKLLAFTASAGQDMSRGVLEILDVATGRTLSSRSLGLHPAGAVPLVHQLVYSSDGRLLAVYGGGDVNVSAPTFVRPFDPRTGAALGKPVRVAPRSQYAPVLSTPDRRLLVITDKAIHAVDAKTLRPVRRYAIASVGAALSPDGGTLATEGPDGDLQLLDLASGRVQTLAGGQGFSAAGGSGLLEPQAFSPDGRLLSTADEDGNVTLWDVHEGEEIETLAPHSGEVWAQAFSPEGRTLYTSSQDGTAVISDVTGARRLATPFETGFIWAPGPTGNSGYAPAFAISPDGRTLAVTRLDGRVDLVDARTLRRAGGFQAFPDRPAFAIEYSPDGRRLAVAGAGGGVGVWDPRTGKPLGPLLRTPRGPSPSNPHTVQALAFAPGGRLAAAEVGGTVRIWDLSRRRLLRAPLRLPPFVAGLAFSPDGSRLAIPFGANDSTTPDGVEVRDSASGERLARLRTKGEVRSLAFSPDGRLLAGGQVDGAALLWETDGWRPVGSPLVLHPAQALGVAFSPDGQALATAHDNGTVVLWDLESQEPVGAPLPGMGADWHSYTWVTARFTPDGRHLFVVSDVGRSVRWEVAPAAWVSHACRVAGGGLTPDEWEEAVPEQDYVSVCPSA